MSLWQSAADHADAITARLGWLHGVEWMQARAGELRAFAGQIAESGHYERAILLGMGGSSLAPAVFASLFEPAPGGLPLAVVDTTHPGEIARIADGDLRRCLFIVSSKSGDTVETIDLYHFFHAQLAAQCDDPGARFVMITDEGSNLHRLGQSGPCNKIFLNPDDVGGRYSALSYFGMVPAALLGVDIDELLGRAQRFCATTKADDPAQNPALALGMFLGRSALAGRDKLILRLPRRLGVFGLWVEQLIAESTGKDGKGLVPVVAGNSGLGPESNLYGGGADRINVRIGYDDQKQRADQATDATDWTLPFDDPYQLGAEYFRWQVATAVAAACIGVNPFDQPDVAQSKKTTALFIHGSEQPPAPACRGEHYDLHYPPHLDAGAPPSGHSSQDLIAEFRRTLEPGCYLGLLAYLPEDPRILSLLQTLGARAAGRWGIVTTLGIGPRYLHSTGQLHKGGPPGGRFIQFIADADAGGADGADQPVPQRDYTFGELYRAQADGDFSVLGRRGAVMRVRLKADRLRALAAFVDDFTGPQS